MFRRARPGTIRWNRTKTLVQSACMWTVFLWLLPQIIVRAEGHLGLAGFSFPGHAWVGALVFALASCGGVWSGYILATHGDGTPLPSDTTNRLVVIGPYRYVRNPMAMTGLAQGAGVGLWLGSFGVLAYVVAGILVWDRMARPAEERFLVAQFGAAYEAYRAEVQCWWPRLRRRPVSSARSAPSRAD